MKGWYKMRLIDANRAMEIVRDQRIAHPNAYHLTNYATLILQEAPTVDAVEVVRCKDCKHYKEFRTKRNKQIMRLCCRMGKNDMEYSVKPDDFCSYGERKEGVD